MKRGLKIVLGMLILIIVIAGIWIFVSPNQRQGITGAVAGVTVAGEKCPAGDDFKTVSQCKAWTNSGIKAKELQILTDDSLDKFCNKVLEMYPEC